MGKELVRGSLDEQWLAMNAALAKVGKGAPVKKTGRLVVGLDLTASREKGLEQARIATAQMFEAIGSIGSVAVKLMYYRGSNESMASKWHADAGELTGYMNKLGCEAGETQIARVLRMVRDEAEPISGVVLILDACEENRRELIELSQELGAKKKPLFIFHECSDSNAQSLKAKPLFKQMAEESRGAYVEFKPDSGDVLKEMLSSVAAFSAGGVEGLKQIAAGSVEGKQLKARLLLSDGTKR